MESQDPNFEKKKEFEKLITRQILRAKKIRWYKQQDLEQIEKEIILTQINELICVTPSPNDDDVMMDLNFGNRGGNQLNQKDQ